MPTSVDRTLRGAAAGALATIPMSVVMLGAQRAGLMGRQPPEVIAKRALDAANADPDDHTVKAAAVAAHLAFGAAAGAMFSLIESEDDDLPTAMAKGIGFGLAIYAASYAGWVPALDLLPHAKDDRKDRQASLIAAHAVYGAALSGLLSVR